MRTYEAVTDQDALEAFQLLARLEGIIPALECAHALAYLTKLAPRLGEGRNGGSVRLRAWR